MTEAWSLAIPRIIHAAVSWESQPATAPCVRKLSVLVGTLNEEASIETCLRRILAVIPASAELIVVDGDHDRTGDVAQRPGDSGSPRRTANPLGPGPVPAPLDVASPLGA